MVAADRLNAAAKSIKDYRNVGANLVFALTWRGEHKLRPYEKNMFNEKFV
jgi:hypothetical protein